MCILQVKMRFNRPSERLFHNEQFAPLMAVVPVEKAPHLSAGLYHAEIAEIEVAQMIVVSQPPTWPWV